MSDFDRWGLRRSYVSRGPLLGIATIEGDSREDPIGGYRFLFPAKSSSSDLDEASEVSRVFEVPLGDVLVVSKKAGRRLVYLKDGKERPYPLVLAKD